MMENGEIKINGDDFTESQRIAIREMIIRTFDEISDRPVTDDGPTCLYKEGKAQLFTPMSVDKAMADGWKDKPGARRGRPPTVRR